MAKQTINIGTVANDGTGDPLRIAFNKTNQNFTEVYDTSGGAFTKANLALQTAQSSYNTVNSLSVSLNTISNTVNVLSNTITNAEFQFIEITGLQEPTGNIVSFTRPANTNLTDTITDNLIIARANIIGGIYNSASENVWNELVSPQGTRWNWSGWDNITDVKTRQYRTFKEALKNRIGNNIIGAELVMYNVLDDKYYKIKFTEWSQGAGGSFAYTRELIDTDTKAGIIFPDGSIQYTSAGNFDWSFIDIHDVNYTIRLDDIDRTIYSFDNTIYIPRDSDVNFPLGSAIYLVTGTSSVTVERVQHIGETEAEIFVSGQVPSVASVVLPQRSISILFKSAPNTWYLAPWTPSNNGSSNVTGNIVISSSNSEINFVANSSGDGAGYSTIELVPDTNATLDQYIIIDPTAPSHIHIRAGGTQNSSQAELYLGGERKYVRVVDGAGVRIQEQNDVDDIYYYTDPTDYTSGTWYEFEGNYYVQFTTSNPTMQGHAFDFTNNTELNELTVYYEGGAVSNTLTSAGSASNLGGGVYRVGVNEAPQANNTSLSSMDFRLFTTNTNYLRMEYNDFEVSVRDDINMYARDTFRFVNYSSTDSIEIFTDYDDQEYRWAFNPNGSMEFPQGGTIRVTSTIPTTSIGSSDDRENTLAFNNTYIYFCTANYDGTTNVWKRLAWSGDTW